VPEVSISANSTRQGDGLLKGDVLVGMYSGARHNINNGPDKQYVGFTVVSLFLRLDNWNILSGLIGELSFFWGGR